MMSHFVLSDNELESQFADGSLDPELFTHEAHLRLAWIHLTNYGLQNAVENLPTQFVKFVSKHDDAIKYNETITVAAIMTVWHFINRSDGMSFAMMLSQFPRLSTSFKDLLLSHYTPDVLFSELAKIEYQEPDLLAYDN